MTKRLALLTLALTTACGGNPSGPSIPADVKGAIEGVWSGTLTTTVRGEPSSGPATLTLTTTPLMAGIGYRARLQASTAYVGSIDTTGDVTTGFPGTPPTTFSLVQNYASTHGNCRVDLLASGQVTSPQSLDANVTGIEPCASSYTGRLTLSKVR